ncbi:unnamed protein product [Mytilus edulis]|uniref:Uncharacterized protein n=1 Tax=Mytilus edulis TaxID=6550 RepID=A0A8S3V498_MYTED|nr:unnamed protein product [Mytilus edulis]
MLSLILIYDGHVSTLFRTIDVTLQHACREVSTVNSAAASAIASAKIEEVKHQTVASACSSEDWTCFVSRWKDYIQATKVNRKDLVIQLIECCDGTLRRDRTRSAGGSLVDESGQDVLKKVCSPVNTGSESEENTMEARVSLHDMTQDLDSSLVFEPEFMAKLAFENSHCNVQDVNRVSTTDKLSYVMNLSVDK